VLLPGQPIPAGHDNFRHLRGAVCNDCPARFPQCGSGGECAAVRRARRDTGTEEGFMDLKGAVAVVTGGNGGLGQRICHALAKEGAHIAVIYAQSRDEAEAVARELTSRHQINAAAFACDVTEGRPCRD